jgi:hypothetical protein
MAEEEKKEKIAFIIAPIGPEGSETRRRIDGIASVLLRPVLDQLGYEVRFAHDIPQSGSIPKQIIESLDSAALVICDLTGLNPNVVYELAVRDARQKAVVLIAEDNTEIPFDFKFQRVHFFKCDPKGLVDFTDEFKRAVEKTMKLDSYDNPISDHFGYKNVIKEGPAAPFAEFVVGQLERIDARLSGIERNVLPEQKKTRAKNVIDAILKMQSDLGLERSLTPDELFGSPGPPVTNILITMNAPQTEVHRFMDEIARKIPLMPQKAPTYAVEGGVAHLYYRVFSADSQKMVRIFEEYKNAHPETEMYFRASAGS